MRAISDEAVKALINSGISTDTDADREYVCECIDNIPTIEPKRGEWKHFDTSWGYKCTVCNFQILNDKLTIRYNFCPNCGCAMTKE